MSFISILVIIVCILLALVILIQNSKGGGIASNFASSTQVVGVKRQNELIEKITWGLAAALFVLCLASSAFDGTNTTTDTTGKESVVGNAEVPSNNASGKQPAGTPNNLPPGANLPPPGGQ